ACLLYLIASFIFSWFFSFCRRASSRADGFCAAPPPCCASPSSLPHPRSGMSKKPAKTIEIQNRLMLFSPHVIRVYGGPPAFVRRRRIRRSGPRPVTSRSQEPRLLGA